MRIYYLFIGVLMIIYFLFIGIKIVLLKRPIFIVSKHLFAFFLLVFSPNFVRITYSLFLVPSRNSDLTIILYYVFYICMLTYVWFLLQGYTVIGVSGDSFREALHYSLNKNNLPFEEKLSTINLTSINAKLQVSIISCGYGQFRLKNSKDKKILLKIVNDIKKYYIENNIEPSIIIPFFHILFGILMLIIAVVIW